MVKNWKTSLMGVLVMACGGTNYAGILPEKYNSLLMLFCGTCTAFGLIAAKDSTVTNAPVPVAAHVVPVEVRAGN